MARAISFRGVGAVVEAYGLNRIAPWAIWSQGKILSSSNDVAEGDMEEGAAQLESFLELMKQHGSQAMYELQVYKLGPGQVDITSKTPYSRAIPFSLFENEVPGVSNSDNRVLALLEKMDARITAMELQRAAEAEAGDDEEEDTTVMGKIGSMAMGLIERPEVQQAIAIGAMNLVRKFVPGMASNNGTQEQEGRKVAGLQQNLLNQEQIDKVHQALTRLSAKDAELGDHLLKVADIADKDPDKYKWVLKFL